MGIPQHQATSAGSDSMIEGYFHEDGTPYVEVRLVLPHLGISDTVKMLVDTGATSTILHPDDGGDMDLPFDELRNEVIVTSVSGTQTYYAEPAVVSFYDGEARQDFRIDLYVAKPHPVFDGLESLLGRDILNQLSVEYDFRRVCWSSPRHSAHTCPFCHCEERSDVAIPPLEWRSLRRRDCHAALAMTDQAKVGTREGIAVLPPKHPSWRNRQGRYVMLVSAGGCCGRAA